MSRKKIFKIGLGALVFIIIIFAINVFITIDKVAEYSVGKPYSDLTFTEKIAAKIGGYKFDTRQELIDKGLIADENGYVKDMSNKSKEISFDISDITTKVNTIKVDETTDIRKIEITYTNNSIYTITGIDFTVKFDGTNETTTVTDVKDVTPNSTSKGDMLLPENCDGKKSQIIKYEIHCKDKQNNSYIIKYDVGTNTYKII
ncbi:hypothetical protein NZ45_07970 [Clostridium botulinum]|uniref:Uncharacterized protein n=1 Tax=Clostridium botulinum TaxID=1491 RepID=A0ABD7CGL5_CLOBO|nr:hypothetical protein [Clostridium botulinum]KGO14288.1 hypothetical protein NZ45_07970 [Clostridium botulinum]QRI52258.1 hypothetical protein JQS73_12550 [Clostridium botulinum]